MPGGLIRGSLILASANKKGGVILATSNGKNITAKQAKAAINKKYEATGGIDRDADYYHRGGNDWAKYSKARDAGHQLKKPRKIAPSGSKKFDNRNMHKGDTKGKRHGRGRL